MDTARLEAGSFALIDGVLVLNARSGSEIRAPLRPPTRGWIRRLAPPLWRRGIRLGTEGAAVRGAWSALLAAIAGARGVAWLTPLERLMLRENKLLQYEAARDVGVRTAASAVVSDRALIPDALGERMVIKPLGTSQYTADDGEEKVVWAQPVERSAPTLAHLGGAPFITQERLEADRHLRVVTVRDAAWVAELDSGGMPLDWRREAVAHGSFAVADEPAVARDALRLAAVLGVGYSSQDWIVEAGEAVFIDLNPAGQWLFLPEEIASAVTAAIAEWLVG